MDSVLYLQSNEYSDIPEFELNQIFFNLYKKNKSDKELLLFRIKIKDNNYIFQTIKKISKDSIDSISVDEFEVKGEIKEELDLFFDKNKDFNIIIIISNLKQSKLLSNYINNVITINKEVLTPIWI